MKTKLLFSIAAITTAFSFSGCKKGADDPFISLHSRKARVVGEWIIDAWKQETTNSGSSTSSSGTSTNSGSDKEEVSGTSVTLSYSSTNTDPTSGTSTDLFSGTGSATAKITFDKDGTFEKTIEYKNIAFTETYTSGSTTSTSNGTYNITKKASGTWNFLGGIGKDYKNKERIILNILKADYTNNYVSGSFTDNYTESYTYANGENSEIWHLLELKNKEIKMEGTIDNSNAWNDVYTGDSSLGTSSQKGTTTGTLTR